MSAFPAGKYARYKRATAFFLDWLLRARGRGQPTGARVDLKALDDVVREIAAGPPTFFAEDDAAQQGHRHFLQLLKSWHQTLMQADGEPDDDDALLEMESTKFENYYEVLQVDEDYFPDEETAVLREAPKTANSWESFKRCGAYHFVPGMLMVDYMNVMNTLASFTSAIPTDPRQTLILRDGFFGPTYGEERTPHYVLPDPSNMVVFLMQQLPHLYNTIIAKKAATGSGYDPSGFTGSFMAQMDEFFTSRKVTVPMVFTCICWLKSVAALQGDAGLSRNVSLTFKHTSDLMKNLEATYAKGVVKTNDQEIHGLLQYCTEEIKSSNMGRHLGRANPLLAGFTMMSHHLQYLNLGGEVIMVTSRFRAFGHLYNALVCQGFLQHIPFFDELLDIYDQMIFTPSRAAVVHGAYNRTYLLSSHMTAASVNALYRGAPPPNKNEEMCDKLDRRQYHDEYIARPSPGESRQYRVNRALEDAVMLLLMPLLDCLQRDGSLDLQALPIGNNVVQTGRLDGGKVTAMCRKVAAVIKAKFATPPLMCDKRYFTFPSRPDFVNHEYGTVSFKRLTGGANRENVFCDLMDMLEESDGPLSESDLKTLKSEIKRDPGLLNMISLRSLSGPDRSVFDPENLANAPRDDLSTLLHQAAAGPAHDAELVEWMIQMGALVIQPTLHCRTDVRQSNLRCPRDDLCRTMAVHSAAIAGHEDIVRIILEADNMIDLNTPTYDTKETLAHLAVKHGHRRLYRVLAALGADLRIKDGNGRSVSEMTRDPDWAHDIAGSTATLEESQARSEGARNRDAQFRHEASIRADQLHRSVAAHRDEERQSAIATADTDAASSSKKKSKKKGKMGKKGKDKGPAATTTPSSVGSVEVDGTANLLKDLLSLTGSGVDADDDSKPLTVLDDSLENTAAMFARLRDLSIPAENKIDDAKRACEEIEKLEGVVALSSHTSRLNSTDRRLRTTIASEASQVFHMMQKLHRVDHAAISVPALASVRKMCATTPSFTSFVVGTAQICASVGRKPQARELLDLLEKRLLKTPFEKREPGAFREMVQTYSEARNGMAMGRTASSDSLRALEWYLVTTVDDYKVHVRLDAMNGRPFYFDLATTANAKQFSQFESAIAAIDGVHGVVCFDKRVVYGGSSEEDVAKVRELILGAAATAGVRFADRNSQQGTPNVRIGQPRPFFLDWLLRARGRAGGKRVQLDEFNEVVREIAADPSVLTTKLLQALPKALVACQCAITYREHVAAFFAEDNEAQLLKGWSQTLEALAMEQHGAAAEEVKRFEDYYEVLEVDEDYFPDEETFVRGKEAPKRAEADRRRLFDQAFDENLRLEVAPFFLELEELVEEVFNVGLFGNV
ncbi:hypothetical protein PHYSODRAFT_264438 [Phytophthora sojae]|uniref:Uncharacterized protein n=1 Tax=Phytophthora sojae (strain P6497) TaxID=1094619 RepID=G4ZGL3_PHYSP|nr:hypothetical protein PHYSODRAFT_264438 [Phytophthora sojae]EGZ17095.1 hypothetical protein PHYSODRAFT_264438 [Phytophthora sojae]|eukprot:XP_009526153.1 hypothetical protein PHYSODRAFT_264438 [Phytophthora sojae]